MDLARQGPLPRRTEQAALLAVLALAAVIGAAALRFDFVYDDLEFVVRNPRAHELGQALRAFGEDVWAFDPTKAGGHYYRPLLVLWVAFGYQLSGGSAAALHAMSLALHLGATVLVHRLGKRLGLEARAALFGAALFALHPIQLQATTWITAANDPLLAVLLLGALLAWTRRPRTAAHAGLALALFTAAMLVNERAALFAPVPAAWGLLVGDDADALAVAVTRAPSKTRRAVGAASALALWIVPVLGVLAAHALVLGRAGQHVHLQLARTLATLPYALARYARNVAWPARLSIAYPETLRAADAPAVALGILVAALALATLGFAVRARSSSSIASGGARAFGLVAGATLAAAPLQVGLLPGFALVQDRYVYLPFAFLALVVADVALPRDRARGPLAIAALAWLLAVTLLAPPNQAIWRDEIALYGRAVEVAPDNAQFLMNYANALRRAGVDDRGCELLRRARDAMERSPESADPPLVHYNLGNCLRRQGDARGAVAAYEAAIAAARGTFTAAEANRALTLLEAGDLDAAEAAAARLTRGSPRDGAAWKLAGVIAARREDFPEAVHRLERASELAPGDASIAQMLDQARRAAR